MTNATSADTLVAFQHQCACYHVHQLQNIFYEIVLPCMESSLADYKDQKSHNKNINFVHVGHCFWHTTMSNTVKHTIRPVNKTAILGCQGK